MAKYNMKELALENAALKRSLQQKDKTTVSIKEKVNALNKKNKAISYKLERSTKKADSLKATLVAEQKKTLKSS